MRKIFFIAALLLLTCHVTAQLTSDSIFSIAVVTGKGQPANAATVELINTTNNKLVKAAIADANGKADFINVTTGTYRFSISYTGMGTQLSPAYSFPATHAITFTLEAGGNTLQTVSVAARKPFVQHIQGKVIINPEASVTNTGTSVLEVLEKSPGVMVDKNGSISLQGKAGVLVMIDDKPTYLSGTELSNLLGGMSSTQVEQIELITNPSAKYDASGNAGIINIKIKKNKQKGFNGSITAAFGHGRYPKSNNSLLLNYRNGKFNTFFTYSVAYNKYYTHIYALRKYYDASNTVISKLDQPTLFNGHVFNNSLKTGVDFYASSKTTIGIVLSGIISKRPGDSKANATWLNANDVVDSAIGTFSKSDNRFNNGAVNLNFKQVISKAQDISADIDWLGYDIKNDQYFNNKLLSSAGYNDASQGTIPATIKIFSAKADYVQRFAKEIKLETGWKSSHVSTDNLASYEIFDGSNWQPDYNKSNHFLYKENIHAVYASVEKKHKHLTAQAGLRYEYTAYKANQLGNIMRSDSAFSKNYNGLFPSGYISYELDSSNSITFTAGRRIDRPAFQKLNPFVFIINKYTYQRGNPFFLPQYTWNMELSHQYKQLLTTTIAYSVIRNYFSQLFLNEGGDILTYTDGNVGRMYNLGISATVQAAPFKWWSLTGQAMFNYKELKGYLGNDYASSVKQLNFSMNNQLRIGKVYAAEISGYYTTRARNDLQELLYPTGQLSVGASRPVLKNKGTLKMSFRDIFYTQAMEGLTQFIAADEYFILRRDSRVFNVSFTYRFGKSFKTSRRNNGGANDEMQRAGSGA